MGMSYEQYWEMSPYLAIDYRKAYRLKREQENEQAWLQGFYAYYAFTVTLSNAFKKRGAKRLEYIEKPIDIYPLTEAEKKRREREDRAKMQKAMEQIRRDQLRRKKAKGD